MQTTSSPAVPLLDPASPVLEPTPVVSAVDVLSPALVTSPAVVVSSVVSSFPIDEVIDALVCESMLVPGMHDPGTRGSPRTRTAESLDVPFVFTSNGDGFLFHDRTRTTAPLERELRLDEFPNPETLLRRYQEYVGLTDEQLAIVTQDPYSVGSGKEPRWSIDGTKVAGFVVPG